ncbi:Uu.00g033560.m01.CDS01 [Anthostomella pinea]|uniref:Uu.00g033560.m01.CDS01 n=1 Tax=Anthostomella pinea TaxID=933095 RepID=A0AAI8V8Z0_9PEZI|nr:Uu.00g033560.m01.CDS01 [Anthostomella pinea]
MCLIFTCGEHTFKKEIQGYEGITCQCHNCGNHSGHVIKSNPWFTFCFVPILPLSIHGYQDITCTVCNFAQPLENRPDVQGMKHGGGSNNVPMQNHNPPPNQAGAPPAGWGGGSPPPPQGQAPMRYQ